MTLPHWVDWAVTSTQTYTLCQVLITVSVFKAYGEFIHFQGTQLCQLFCLPFKKGVYSKKKAFAPNTGLGGSVGCAVRLETRRSRVQPPRQSRQHSFVEIDHEIFSTIILSLQLIEGQLSVSEKECAQYWLTA